MTDTTMLDPGREDAAAAGGGSHEPSIVQQALALAVCGALAIAGAGVALLLRDDAVSEHRAEAVVDLADIIPMEFWQANAVAGRFAQTLPRSDVRDAAADQSRVPASELTRTEVDQLGDSSVVSVALTSDGEEESARGLLELLRATFGAMLDSDRSVPNSVVEGDGPRLDALEADMAATVEQAGLAPGTDLAQAFNNETSSLAALSFEVGLIDDETPDWLESQIRGKEFAASDALSRIEPHVDAWYAAAEAAELIRRDVEDAREDLVAIDRGVERLGTLEQDVVISSSMVSSREAAARTAAGGAAIGLALGLIAVGGVAVARRRSPAA